MQQSRIFVGMVLILIFGEVLGLYGYGEMLGLKHLHRANLYAA
jgi:F0F1-type ATP synthase membrane subunit c/vacuolar-type H+-ATPase subunit K